jgi:hypothetical protein
MVPNIKVEKAAEWRHDTREAGLTYGSVRSNEHRGRSLQESGAVNEVLNGVVKCQLKIRRMKLAGLHK